MTALRPSNLRALRLDWVDSAVKRPLFSDRAVQPLLAGQRPYSRKARVAPERKLGTAGARFVTPYSQEF